MARVTTPESFTASHHAAVEHTNAMIKDGTIENAKIKDGTIETAKLSTPLDLAAIPTPLTGKVITDITQGTHADRPAAGNLGKIYAETDTKALFWDDGTEWQDCKPAPIFDSFETDPDVDMNGWTYSELDTNELISLERTGSMPAAGTSGTYCWRITSGISPAVNDYGQITKNFDMTSATLLWLNLELYLSASGDGITVEVFVGGALKKSFDLTVGATTFRFVRIDVSGESGDTEVKIKITFKDTVRGHLAFDELLLFKM